MAITSPSQIFNAENVKTVAKEIDYVINSLNNARGSLESSLTFCDESALLTNEGNAFPGRIKSMINRINEKIAKLSSLKNNIIATANNIAANDRAAYEKYKAELEAAEAAEEQANN